MELEPKIDYTSVTYIGEQMGAALRAPAIQEDPRRHYGAMALVGLSAVAVLSPVIHSVMAPERASASIVSVGDITPNGSLLSATAPIGSDGAGGYLLVSTAENVSGPAGSGSCGFLDKTAADARYKANPEAPAQSKAEAISFLTANPDRADKIATAMRSDEAPLLDKIVPAGKTDSIEYFKNMNTRRSLEDVTVFNSYCDSNGNVIKWRAEKLPAGTDFFAFVVNDGVFTRADGTTVTLTEADMANSIVVHQNGETLLLELKDPCNNELDRIAPGTVVVATTSTTEKAKEESTTTSSSTSTSTTQPPIIVTTTSTTQPPVIETTTTLPRTTTTLPRSTTTTIPVETTTTTIPVIETTTSTTQPVIVTTTTLPRSTTTTIPVETTTTTIPVIETTTTIPATTTTAPSTTIPNKDSHPPISEPGMPTTTIAPTEAIPTPPVPTTNPTPPVTAAPTTTILRTPETSVAPTTLDTRPAPTSTEPPATTPGVPTSVDGGPAPSILVNAAQEITHPEQEGVLPITLASAFAGSALAAAFKRPRGAAWKYIKNYSASIQ